MLHRLTSDVDPRDRRFLSGERTSGGLFRIEPGMGVEYAIARSLAYAPYAETTAMAGSTVTAQGMRAFASFCKKKRLLFRRCARPLTQKTSAGP
jgi:isocitrate lyase